MIVLTTKRLLLRPVSPEDLDALAALHAGTGLMDTPMREQSAANWRAHGFGLFAVTDRRTGALVGGCGLCRRESASEAELACWIVPGHRGRGLAAEAAAAVLCDGFERVGLARVVALVRADDRRALRLMRKVGMTLETGLSPADTALARYAIGRETFLGRCESAAAPATLGTEAAHRTRQERLAEALRRNLRRRKEQTRGRGGGAGDG